MLICQFIRQVVVQYEYRANTDKNSSEEEVVAAMPAQKQLQPAQLQKIWLLSDTVLYREAVDFVQNLVSRVDPLPMSQVNGLLNITGVQKLCGTAGFCGSPARS